MQERFNINKKDAPNNRIENESSFVKPSWFKAYYEGNSLIPQTGDGFVTSLMISTILDETDTDWDQFFDSKFSKEQLTFLGNAMSAMHSHKKVNISTEINAHLFKDRPKVIPEEKIQTLWKGAKGYLMLILISYINSEDFNTNKLKADTFKDKYNINTVKNFFNDTGNNKKLVELRKALEIVKNSMKDKEIVKLLSKYREEFNDPKNHKMNYWEKCYGEKFREILNEKVTNYFNGVLPEHLRALHLFNNFDM